MALPSGRSADCTRRSYGGDEAQNRRPGRGPAHRPDARERRSYADAAPRPFWLDSPRRAAPRAPLEGHAEADLAIVGRRPQRPLGRRAGKADRPGTARSCCSRRSDRIRGHRAQRRLPHSSLTHGVANGMSRFPDEMPLLERLGRQNFDRTVVALGQFEIDCDLELNGDLAVALEPHEERWLAEEAQQLERPRPRRRAPRPGCACAPSSTPPSTAPGCGSAAAPGSSTRPSSLGAWRTRPRRSARACTNAHR